MSRCILIAGVLVAGFVHPPARAATPVMVVLDPGHGGEEHGTVNAELDVKEKDVTLLIAGSVRTYLRGAGVKVRLTRPDDRSIGLRARAELANRLRAAALVSIHLNHAPDPKRRGFETYVLSARASDEQTQALLSREEGTVSTSKAEDDLSFILGDLGQAASVEKSARLAQAIQTAAGRRSGLAPSRGLRQAPFTVLSSARVPAVLVEVAYLSNPDQARFFRSRQGIREAAKAIAEGLLRFLGKSAAPL